MKNVFYLLLLFVSFSFAQGEFEKGNASYRKGDYADAVASYENVLSTKKHSAELYFNLGNAYYKLNKIAPAIYNYEKALLLDPNDAVILNNLKFAQKAAIDDVREVPHVGFTKMLENLAATFAYDSWAWIAVVFAFASLLFFIGYYFSGNTLRKRIYFVGMFVAVFVIAVSVGSAILSKDAASDERNAIVFEDVLPVKAEPKTDAPDAFVLHEGTKVAVVDTLDVWRKVKLPDDTQGWVPSNAIKEIK
ncbi:MAG: BatE protein [Flavobacterium sp. BFFFF1]|uniref:tetratricopeptide repeat protein n=1 Tax=Flavobacterium sp. BFFFF1 TaxID=2015557 RepID=UPI000BD36091|nr:tetratricopeptide repeat protein [Flavobacterium sp. BFFFF1]OYU80921.1 MAG: BatE protein [Flavobacterium sp. BFFFF1]